MPEMNLSMPSLGWDDRLRAAYKRHDRRGQRPGRVARVDRGICTVLTAEGTVRASLSGRMLGDLAADPASGPCAGDWVVVRQWPDDRTTLEAVLPRKTSIVRAGAGKAATGQVIATNIDIIAVVEPLDPDPDPGRIERLMTLAWDSGATPILLLTKADAVGDPAALALSFADSAPGVPIIPVSTVNGEGLDVVAEYVPSGRTMALVGPSGAGKSSLVNALAGAEVMVTRALRADGRGRHTTSYRALVPVPGGGVILDTPGLRSVGLFDRDNGEGDGLVRAFADVEELVAACRFSDCRHDTEPDCAVREALELGALSARRYENWRKLQRELAFERRRVDARARAVQRDKDRKRQQAATRRRET
ncbi:ribosome small subunit-dependent GTPase A [Phytomonospora endophytica]|nr:ribosome small subunit-dependent GTPase A [Phytomonospora endophytica]